VERLKSAIGCNVPEIGATLTNLSSDAVTLDSMVARLNIKHYRKVLSEEIDGTKRPTPLPFKFSWLDLSLLIALYRCILRA
jgi:hypothetical protein